MLGIAAVFRFWALSRPGTLVFDELYYVRDAISQLAHGFPTVWPDDDPDMSGGRALGFTGTPANAVHPPLGKWLIGLGILAFGPDNGWGWRSAVALAGVATVAVTMRLGWLMSRSLVIACTAGLLLAIDGVHVVLTRVGLLDGFLTLFVALGALFVWRDGASAAPGRHGGIAWRRPWLLAAGLAFGAAAAVKWSGLYALAGFLVFIAVRDLLTRLRAARAARPPADDAAGGSGADRGSGRPAALGRSVLQALVTAVIAIPAAALAYLASWTGWILNPGGWAREPGVPWPVSLLRYHAEMLAWHSTLSAPHPYQSSPLSWPLALRPTSMYRASWSEGCPWAECVSTVTPVPNPLVSWGGVAALLALAVIAVLRLRAGMRARTAGAGTARAGADATGPGAGALPVGGRITEGGAAAAVRASDPLVLASAFVITAYLSGWLPWVLTVSRSAVFQFYAVVLTPFSALALALLLGGLCGVAIRSRDGAEARLLPRSAPGQLRERRISAALFLAASLALAVLYLPVWSGVPIAEWFWRAHMWLPGWA
ncbi:dolichyl-phosphate-mannose--protein O-mannosyl transferase [Leucobacter massiliensis]|uniref:Polyprenol-phosphate-mannose--protein mannosyltransferase n=1 Tax=Leucobacter massiliensis TaxID=1686285 RepID=A0A2S9QLV5_9MICO|nr:dolichyl-phosphate-mannose--protein O-mannosyl transferase [Leucobacter massiliensis]